MSVASWLFVKESQSTWVERPQRHSLRIAGPGAAREQREFSDEASLEDFLVTLAERLTAEGWILSQVNHDRRRVARRQSLRIGPDRRTTS